MDEHELYLNYIEDWELTHADPVFDGLTPMCFEDWKNSIEKEAYESI